MITIYLNKHQAEQFTAGKLKAALVKPRKRPPMPGDTLKLVAGGWGNGKPVGEVTCRATGLFTRTAPKRWARGSFVAHQSLYGIDERAFAQRLGYESIDELDAKWSKQKPNQPLIEVRW